MLVLLKDIYVLDKFTKVDKLQNKIYKRVFTIIKSQHSKIIIKPSRLWETYTKQEKVVRRT